MIELPALRIEVGASLQNKPSDSLDKIGCIGICDLGYSERICIIYISFGKIMGIV